MNVGRCSGGKRAVSTTTASTSTVPSSTLSKVRRVVVNGGGVAYVNRPNVAFDLRNETVMSVSQVPNGQSVSAADVAQAYARSNVMLIESLNSQCTMLKKLVLEKDETISRLSHELKRCQQDKAKAHQQLSELKAITVREEQPSKPTPCTPVPSTCSSQISDLNTAELPAEQPSAKTRRRRTRPAVSKQPNSHQLEHNQTKKSRIGSTRNKSCVAGKMQELSLITEDKPYYTCLGNFDPVRDDPIPGIKNSTLEIPSWRLKPYSSWYSMEGTENMSDDIFESRHSRLELWERRRKRWDLQRFRELKRIEYLKEGRNKNHSQNEKEEELTTLLPPATNIKAIEVTNNLPVSAFGVNLHVKKDSAPFKFFRTKYAGFQLPPHETKTRELRSSGRNPSFECHDST